MIEFCNLKRAVMHREQTLKNIILSFPEFGENTIRAYYLYYIKSSKEVIGSATECAEFHGLEGFVRIYQKQTGHGAYKTIKALSYMRHNDERT